jgi:molybdopterin-synthase adenylyltransferase
MRREIVFGEALYDRTRQHVLKSAPNEEAAVLLCGAMHSPEMEVLLVREFHPIPESGFISKGGLFLSIDPGWYGPLLKRCREENLSFVLVHSHPFSSGARFSGTDDEGERQLMPRLLQRAPNRAHGAIVFGTELVSARVWLPGDVHGQTAVATVRGAHVRVVSVDSDQSPLGARRFARQVLALGGQGQAALARLRVGLVGLGGLGSHVYVQAKYLGIQTVICIDPDRIEESNLSRLMYANHSDLGRAKVDVAVEWGARVLPSSEDRAIALDVRSSDALSALRTCDVLITTTDNLVSRLTVNRLLTQYLCPMLDAGLDVDAPAGRVQAIGGRVTRLIPDGGCLACIGIASTEALAREAVRETPGYIQGAAVEAPAVVSLNGVLASLLMCELLEITTGYSLTKPDLPRSLIFDGRRLIVRAVSESPKYCGVCRLVYALGDTEPLPALG